MKKINVKKVYAQDELVEELMRAGELMAELDDCRVAECDGCASCWKLDEEVNVRELGYFMHYYHYYKVPSAEDYYTVAQSIKEMPADDYRGLALMMARSKKLEYWELIRWSSWDSQARKKLKFWEEV